MARETDPRAQLERVARQLAPVERRRAALIAERDALVSRLREAGVPWTEIAGAAGVSRQALMKRAGRP